VCCKHDVITLLSYNDEMYRGVPDRLYLPIKADPAIAEHQYYTAVTCSTFGGKKQWGMVEVGTG